jgi:hypothetical protein
MTFVTYCDKVPLIALDLMLQSAFSRGDLHRIRNVR